MPDKNDEGVNDFIEEGEAVPDDEKVLLREILGELRNIGLQLQGQNERIQKLEEINPAVISSAGTHATYDEIAKTRRSSTAGDIRRSSISVSKALQFYQQNIVRLPGIDQTVAFASAVMPMYEQPAFKDTMQLGTLGEISSLPFDRRLSLSFQQHSMRFKKLDEIRHVVSELTRFEDEMSKRPPLFEWNPHQFRNYFAVSDWLGEGVNVKYRLGQPKSIYGVNNKELDIPSRAIDLRFAPWRRVIQIQGLCSVSQDDFRLSSKCPYFEYPMGFSHTIINPVTASSAMYLSHQNSAEPSNPIEPLRYFREGSRMRRGKGMSQSAYINHSLWISITRHLKCQRRRTTDAVMSSGSFGFFHVTFYEIVILHPDQDQRHDEWKRGKLHSDKHEFWPDGMKESVQEGERTRSLRESAYTIFAVSSREDSIFEPSALNGTSSDDIFWTILELSPEHFHQNCYSYEEETQVSPSRTSGLSVATPQTMHRGMSRLIVKSIAIIIHRWESLLDYFEHLISEKKAFLDPDYHDSLLSDDETFSRSKRYFWAIDTLKEVGSSIAENVKELRHFVSLYEADGAQSASDPTLRTLRSQQRRLERLDAALREKRDEAMALRDGLFSASAVVESRASTRLGENVKLLTLVSIFFLPLSFCASLWSISAASFSLAAFGVTAPLVALATYLLVFNLDSVVRLGAALKRSAVDDTIELMQRDGRRRWRERGRAFRRFAWPARGVVDERPSAWRIVQFAAEGVVFRAARAVGARFGWTGREGDEDDEEESIYEMQTMPREPLK